MAPSKKDTANMTQKNSSSRIKLNSMTSRNRVKSNVSKVRQIDTIKAGRNTIAISWRDEYRRKLKRIMRKIKKDKKC